MSLVYPVTVPIILFGTKTATVVGGPLNTIASSITLTNTYATSGSSKVFVTGGYSELVLMWKYTTGTGESGTNLNIQVLGANETSNFYLLTNESSSSGVSTLFSRTFATGGGSAATAYSQSYRIDISYKYLKVQVEEAGVSSNFGTLFMEGSLAGY